MVRSRFVNSSWCAIALVVSACSQGTRDDAGTSTTATDDANTSEDASSGDGVDSGDDTTSDGSSSSTDTGEPNRPPMVQPETCAVAQLEPLMLQAPGVLGNDADPDGDPLTVTSEGTSELGVMVKVMPDGSFTYEAPATVWGLDRFGYEVDDGAGGVAFGEVAVRVHPVAAELAGVRTGSGGFSIEGAGATESAGTGLAAAGDVDGDGLADILIGAPEADAAGEDAGRVYVVFGKADHESLTLFDVAEGRGGFVIEAEGAGDLLGTSVAGIGDVNADGRDDLLMGAPSNDAAGEDAGRAYLLLGKADGDTVDLADASTRADLFALDGEQAGDRFGFEVSGLEDLDGDGRPDFAVSAVDADEAAGRIYVVFTPDDPSTIDVATVAQGNGGILLTGEVTLDRAGTSLARASDMNGDGRSELVVGAPGQGPNDNNSGRVYVVFGRDTAAVVNLGLVAAGTGGFVIDGEAENDLAGEAVAAGFDYDGDGRGDVLVGAFAADGTAASAGRSYLVHGKADGAAVSLSDVRASQGGFGLDGGSLEDGSGYAVAFVGDHDADGRVDLAVGAPAADGEHESAGRVYVLLEPPRRPGALDLDDTTDGTLGFSLTGDSGSSFAGASVTWLGDVDGDGIDDFAVGAPGAPSSAGGTAGRVSVLFGASREPFGPVCE